MNLVILGAGTVGTSIAQLMCANHHNVCIIDRSAQALATVEEELDVQVVRGSGCDVATLFQGGILGADLLLAVTSLDEVNLIGASLAKAMGVRRAVARVFDPTFLDTSTFDYQKHFHIDRLLSLEFLTALELAKSIRMAGLFAIENFARGAVEVREVSVEKASRAVGVPLKELKLPRGVRIGLISETHATRIPVADDVVQAGDRVTLIGSRQELEGVSQMFEKKGPRRLNVVIAGGGETGFNLARLLQGSRCNITLMEADADRCEYLASRLPEATILRADITRRLELEEARVGKADVFVAATGHDEDNIVFGVEARELGCKRVLTVVRRPDYANVLEKLGIDVAVSPREVMARQVLGMVQQGPIIARTVVADGQAEVWEVDVAEGCPITQAPLRDIELRRGLIAAYERGDHTRVPGGDDQLQGGDTAVVLVHRSSVDETLALFKTH